MERPKKVFCSFRNVDKAEVEAFARQLRDAGIEPWFSDWEIAPTDSIVASMNRGIQECDAALVFFSSRSWSGHWFEHEVDTLIVRRNEDGIPLIVVTIDEGATLPPLLRPLARRSIDQFQQIVDGISPADRKRTMNATVTSGATRVTVRLIGPNDGTIDIVVLRDGSEVARESGVRLTSTLRQSFAEFLQGHFKVATRGPAEAKQQSLNRAVAELGDALGEVLFANRIGAELRTSLAAVSAGGGLEVCFEASDSTLLALPFEAARLDGTVVALVSGVTIRRVVAGARTVNARAAASPLKVLVAVGAPDEGQSNNPELDLEYELQGILDAVSSAARDRDVAVRFLEVGHPVEIGRALAHDEFHVLHLSGHGGPGVIELEDEDGSKVVATARTLANEIKRARRNIPLVFLSSCYGGASGSETASLAVDLVREGVPLVLSMQTRVTDRYASDLAGELYAELASPKPPLVSQALALARQRLEDARLKAVASGASVAETQPEYATASLFGGESEIALVDNTLPPVPLAKPPVHKVPGPVPQLGIGELVGRRRELRDLLRVLRDHKASVAAIGKKAGVVLVGIGGVGKSSLAGRAMARLKEDGWIVAATTGRFSIGGIAAALGDALTESGRPHLAPLASELSSPQLDDRTRLKDIVKLLQTERVLLVLDNFEDNLEVGGAKYLDETTATWLTQFAERAQIGKLLITCRYPLPVGDGWFAHQTLGPLSASQTRKLFWRLPGINGLSPEDLTAVMRHIGGHPRMLEYLDGILRKGNTRLAAVTARLRSAAKDAGVSLGSDVGSLDEALRNTVLLGARDILLDELVAIAQEHGDKGTLLQCAVSSLPIDAAGVAHALADAAPTPEAVRETRVRLERLVDLSLVTRLGSDRFWVHRWTAEALAAHAAPAERREVLDRAARYRLSRTKANVIAFVDIVEATRNFLDAERFSEASRLALQIIQFLVRDHQSMAAAAFAGEILRRLPATHGNWAALTDLEAQSLLRLGFTQNALNRYHGLLAAHEEQVRREPDRNDYQTNLSVSYERIGDLYRDLGQGEAARDAYLKALAIHERLTQAEPDRADYQRALSVSCNKVGDICGALGQGEQARDALLRGLAIAERLAQAEPDRSDFQHDLSMSYNKVGDLYRAVGQAEQARHAYLKALAIRERLVEAEPGRADYQRDLSVSFERTGDLYRTFGQGELARQSYLKMLGIRERLAQAEPDRADYQRDLSVSYDKVGDLYEAVGQTDAARGAYLNALAISERLAEAEPDRADYQRDLSVSYNKIGDLYEIVGQAEPARDAYLKALAIAERLAHAEPNRTDYLRDLSVVYSRIADVYTVLGQGEQARDAHAKDLAIAERLAQAEPDRADYQRDLCVSYSKMGDLYRDVGQVEPARDAYLKALAIAERLARAEPDRSDHQRDIVLALVRIGALDERTEALSRALTILSSLAASGRLDPVDQPLLERLRHVLDRE